MSNLLYNPIIDLGAVLVLAGAALTALRGVRRFAWLAALGAAVGLGGWFFPLQSAQLGALLHFPAAKTALRSVPVSQIKAIAAGKAPASELTPQYVAGLKLDPSAGGFSGFNGEAKAIANSPMAHNAKWVAETAVLAVLEGNKALTTALGYNGGGISGLNKTSLPSHLNITAYIPGENSKITEYIPPNITPEEKQMDLAAINSERQMEALALRNLASEDMTIQLSPIQKIFVVVVMYHNNVPTDALPTTAAKDGNPVAPWEVHVLNGRLIK